MSASANKKVLALCGSSRKNSSNRHLIQAIKKLAIQDFTIALYEGLDRLPLFNADDQDKPPAEVVKLLNEIKTANGILIATPEYIFSLPASLKNVFEWAVSAAAFSKKPVALITASSLGEKAAESLHLIMTTLEANIAPGTELLIQGIRSKVNSAGDITDAGVQKQIQELIYAFAKQL